MLTYRLGDQARVDHGKEFHLMLYVQEVLAQFRTNTNRAPHLQSTSHITIRQIMKISILCDAVFIHF